MTLPHADPEMPLAPHMVRLPPAGGAAAAAAAFPEVLLLAHRAAARPDLEVGRSFCLKA